MTINNTLAVKLTAKQEGFAQSVVDGLNQSDAYRAHYRTENWLPASVHEKASELAATVKVSSRITELKAAVTAELATKRVWDQSRFLDEAETNMDLARRAGQLAPANGALALIGKVTGIVAETTTLPDSALDAVIRLAELMSEAQLRAQAALPAIEGVFEVIPSENTDE